MPPAVTTQKAAILISVAKEMVKVILRRDGERGEGGSSSEPRRVSAGLADMPLYGTANVWLPLAAKAAGHDAPWAVVEDPYEAKRRASAVSMRAASFEAKPAAGKPAPTTGKPVPTGGKICLKCYEPKLHSDCTIANLTLETRTAE